MLLHRAVLALALACSAAEEPVRKNQHGQKVIRSAAEEPVRKNQHGQKGIRNGGGLFAGPLSGRQEETTPKMAKRTKAPTMYPTAAPTDSETCDICSAPKQDVTYREEVAKPGIPNLEYIGLGYNILEGNPRGSDISEVDPGFRSGVIKLTQDLSKLTIDEKYMVPFGVDVRYTTACMFSSESTELSNTKQYQNELSQEATQSRESSVGLSIPLFSVSAQSSFSKSEKYTEFAETTSATQSVTFEARALCSEFKATLQPGFNYSRTDLFQKFLDDLPSPYDYSEEHKGKYSDFFIKFGTHYVSDVTLGAKHIFSSEIKSSDVSDLVEEEIDVSSTLSWSAQASFGGGGRGNEAFGELVRREVKFGGDGQTGGGVGLEGGFTEYQYVFEDPSVGGGTSREETNSSNERKSAFEQVKSKVQTVREMNVGGDPPEDGNWKTWATTVRDRPMPIAYELTGIWNLMASDESKKAFYDALVDVYDLETRNRTDSTILDRLRFGVSRGTDGVAISSYNRDPNSNFRTSIRLATLNEDPNADFPTYEYDLQRDAGPISALFATPIRGDVSESEEEDRNVPSFARNTQNVYTNYGDIDIYRIPFGFLDGKEMKIRIQDRTLGANFTRASLQSLSFLSAENLPAEKKFIAGVVHPDGYPINEDARNSVGFRVAKRSAREFRIIFDDPEMNDPTFLSSPLWFPGFDDENIPRGPLDVLTATRSCGAGECSVVTGANVASRTDPNFLGFSFLALSKSLNATTVSGIVHGVVTISVGSSGIPEISGQSSQGFHATVDNSSPPDSPRFDLKITGQNTGTIISFLPIAFEDVKWNGGILITFEKPFRGLPAVIVNPIIGNRNMTQSTQTSTVLPLFDGVTSRPSAIVEYITETTALVKVDWLSVVLDSGLKGSFEPISFHIVAVGPQRDPFLPE